MNTPVSEALTARRPTVLALALPIILSNLTVPMVGVVDTAVMGRMDAPVYVSATAAAAVLFSSIYWVLGFLRMGTGGLVAQAAGAGSPTRVNEHAWRGFALAVLLGTVLVVGSGPLAGLFLRGLGGGADLNALVLDYYRVRIWSAPGTLSLYVLFGVLIGVQRMRVVFALQLLLNLTNMLLTLAFFTYTDWGIKGVAAATVLSEYLSLALGLWVVRDLLFDATHRPRCIRLLDKRALGELFTVNADLFVRTLCLTIAFYWMTRSSAQLGEPTFAANAILIQLLHVMAYALDGFAHATETLAGQAFGRRDPAGLHAVVRTASGWSLLFAVGFSLAYWVAGPVFIGWITTQEIVQSEAARWLPWLAAAPLLAVWSYLLDGLFIGVTHTREMRNGMIASLVVQVLLTLCLMPILGNHGLWIGYYGLMVMRVVTLGIHYPKILQRARTLADREDTGHDATHDIATDNQTDISRDENRDSRQ